MSKETIPQSIIDKINKEYPFMHFEEKGLVREFRCAAEFGYNLAEGRIKELEELLAPLLQNELKGDDLESSDIKIASPVSTRPSSFTNSIEQENLLIIQTKTNNMNNIELVDFFAASALQGLISKLPLLDRDGQFADKLSSDEIQAIKKELCESAYNYACHMLNAKTEFKDFIKKHEYGNQSAQ